MKGSRWVPIGKLVRPHSIRGALKVYPYGETLASKKRGDNLYVGLPHTQEQVKFTLLDLKPQGKYWVAQFEELTSRDEAQRFAGKEIFLTEDLLPPTEDGEYYHYQLVGLDVFAKAGSRLGILQRILGTGANDIYVIQGEDGREILVPAIEEVILQVDLEAGRMLVDLPEGLADAL